MRKILFIVLASWFMVVSGCGYTTRSMISDKYRNIYIAPFVNKIDITQQEDVDRRYKIYRPHIETDITRVVTNKYLFDGNLKPVKEETADLVLKGEITDFRMDPVRYDDNNEVSEYRINLVVNLILTDRTEDKVLWTENGFVGYSNFFTGFATGDVVRKTQDQATNDALADLARRVVERTVEQW